MAVPSSGELKISGIAKELLQDDYNATNGYTNISLGDMGSGTSPYSINTASSSYPNSSAPHGMAEWYSYDNDAASATAIVCTTLSYANPCFAFNPATTTRYMNTGTMAVNTYVYTNIGLTTALASGTYGYNVGGFGAADKFTVGFGGKVTAVSSC